MLKIDWHKADSHKFYVNVEEGTEDIDYALPSEFATDLNESLGSFPPVIRFTEIGHYFTGIYIAKEMIEIKDTKREVFQYFFYNPNKVKVMIWGAGILDRKMNYASFNDHLFIGYVGPLDVGQPQPAKNFIVNKLGIPCFVVR